MEFLRFGSSIPGSYWGCCAVDIIQNFSKEPSEKASIQLVNGDGGTPLQKSIDGELKEIFAGPTYEDIFWTRMRIGTFSKRDMPNHAFLAVLTDNQINTVLGKKWLAVLKKAGFEFLRTVSNSVYSGDTIASRPPEEGEGTHKNHLFGLFRNIGVGGVHDPFTPPPAWTKLPETVPYASGDSEAVWKAQKEIWENPDYIRKPLFRSELEKEGVPITLAGTRSLKPQELESVRLKKQGKEENLDKTTTESPWTASYDDTLASPAEVV